MLIENKIKKFLWVKEGAQFLLGRKEHCFDNLEGLLEVQYWVNFIKGESLCVREIHRKNSEK